MSPAPLPRLDWLRAFASFSRHLNFTRAARELGLSQPALHAQVRQLEALLEAKLYVRHGRQLSLTPKGREVAAFSVDLLDTVGEFVARSRSGRGDPRPVRLAAGEGAYLYLLGPALEAFGAENPTQALSLLTLSRDEALDALSNGLADLAVCAGPTPPSSHGDRFRTHRLRQVPMALALREGHPLCAGPSSDLDRLAEVRWIAPPKGRPLRRALEIAFETRFNHPPRVVTEATGWPLMLEFVRLGLGVALVNGLCVPPDGVVMQPCELLAPVTYWLVERRRPTAAPLPADALRDVLLHPVGPN